MARSCTNFSHAGVVLGQFVKGGIQHFALDGALAYPSLPPPLVDEQHDEVRFRIVG
jgi:hypothetical protein